MARVRYSVYGMLCIVDSVFCFEITLYRRARQIYIGSALSMPTPDFTSGESRVLVNLKNLVEYEIDSSKS